MENNYPIIVPNLSSDQLPKKIRDVCSDISLIDQKIESAISQAGKAKELADEASEKSAGWSFFGDDKREAIEALQKSNLMLANALSENVEASDQLFKNQKKMANGLSYLFHLGVMNLAANRTVVRELEMRLRDASKEELGDLARQEIQNVILQLRAQEDIHYAIDQIEGNIREINNQLADSSSEIERFKSSCNSTLDEVKTLKAEIQKIMVKQSEEFHCLNSELRESNEQNFKCIQNQLCELLNDKERHLDSNLSSFKEYEDKKICAFEIFKEEEIARRSIFTSKVYNLVLTLIAVVSLIISILY